MTPHNHSINYIEFPLVDTAATKKLFSGVFGWQFTDWGPDYISFAGAGIDGGFNKESRVLANKPGVLVVLYATDLEATLDKLQKAGAAILKDIYSFPGGRRFHFQDPNGNELAVWSDKGLDLS